MTRFALFLTTLALVTGGTVAAVAVAGDSRPPDGLPAGARLPDLDQLAPYDLSLERVGSGARTRWRLRFTSAFANVGPGPIVIDGRRTGIGRMAGDQSILGADGRLHGRAVRDVAEVYYDRDHDHWHLRDAARYQLREAEGGAIVRRDRKQGFCLGDRFDPDPAQRLPGEPFAPDARWNHDCGRGEPARGRLRQGISPGWGDDYRSDVHGQYLDITTLAPGTYDLVNIADPARNLREVTRANNAASVRLVIGRTSGRPTFRVTRRCERTARCAG